MSKININKPNPEDDQDLKDLIGEDAAQTSEESRPPVDKYKRDQDDVIDVDMGDEPKDSKAPIDDMDEDILSPREEKKARDTDSKRSKCHKILKYLSTDDRQEFLKEFGQIKDLEESRINNVFNHLKFKFDKLRRLKRGKKR